MRSLLTVCVWLAIQVTLEALWHRALGLSGFGIIFLLYLDFAVVLPLLSLWLWIRHFALGGHHRMTRPAATLALLTLTGPAFAYYATWVEPFDLKLEEHTVGLASGRGGGADFTIAVIADLQARKVTEYERRAIALVMANNPDIILIAGDIIHWSDMDEYVAAIPEFQSLLQELHAPSGVYFVQGNTDVPELESLLFQDTDVIPLLDEMTNLEIRGNKVTLGGLALAHHRVASGQALLQRMESDSEEADIRILLSHMPDPLLDLSPNSRIDLIVAGHTHGGQVQIPFFGPPITLSQVPRYVAAGGLSEHEGNVIYVSRGIGVERAQAPRVRFLSPPEVSLLTVVSNPPSGRN